MIRRPTRLARLLSVATGPLILCGCATRTVVFDTDASRGAITSRPGRPGSVIAAPHGTSDVRTGDIAADLAQRTGFGVVIATGFSIEPDTRERAGRRYQVNRPMEGVPGRQARRNPASAGARPPHRAAEGRPHGVARGLYGGPCRLPPPGRRRRPGTVTAVQGIFTAEEMRRLDARAIAELGISGATLMENAGRGAAEAIRALLEDLKARSGARVVIVCGKGGNGGDGFVVARWLRKWGARVEVLLAFPEDEIRGDAGEKLRELKRSGVRPRLVRDLEAAEETLPRADVIVDAPLGTGSPGAPEGRVARLMELINASGRPVVALDIPSGISADGDAPAGPAVRALLTLTFAGGKRGLVTGPGAALAGQVEVVPIGIPPDEVLRRGARGDSRAAGGRRPRHRGDASEPAARRRRPRHGSDDRAPARDRRAHARAQGARDRDRARGGARCCRARAGDRARRGDR